LLELEDFHRADCAHDLFSPLRTRIAPSALARLLESLQAVLEREDYILNWFCFHVGGSGLGSRSDWLAEYNGHPLALKLFQDGRGRSPYPSAQSPRFVLLITPLGLSRSKSA
jgi:hypothetical protein